MTDIQDVIELPKGWPQLNWSEERRLNRAWLSTVYYEVLPDCRREEFRRLADVAAAFVFANVDGEFNLNISSEQCFPQVSAEQLSMVERALQCICENAEALLPYSEVFAKSGCVDQEGFAACIHECLYWLVINLGLGLESDRIHDSAMLSEEDELALIEEIKADAYVFGDFDELIVRTDFANIKRNPSLMSVVTAFGVRGTGIEVFDPYDPDLHKDEDGFDLLRFQFYAQGVGIYLRGLALASAVEFVTVSMSVEDFVLNFNLLDRAIFFGSMATLKLEYAPIAINEFDRHRAQEVNSRLRQGARKRHTDSQELQQKYCPIIHDLVENQGMKIKQAVFSIEDQVIADAADQRVQFKPDNYERTVRGWYTKWRKKQGAAVQTSGPRK